MFQALIQDVFRHDRNRIVSVYVDDMWFLPNYVVNVFDMFHVLLCPLKKKQNVNVKKY